MTIKIKPKTVTAKLTPIDDKQRVRVKVKVPKTENVIFIGSEMYYDSFWLKMMFIAAARVKAETLRPADKKTIAYVDNGYTYAEKLALDYLRDKKGFEIVKLSNSADLVSYMNKDRDTYKLQDVAFFSHGEVGKIVLNYKGEQGVNLGINNFSAINPKAFAVHGRLYSYACRTGVSVDDLSMGFEKEADAKPELSLAQKLANHFGI